MAYEDNIGYWQAFSKFFGSLGVSGLFQIEGKDTR